MAGLIARKLEMTRIVKDKKMVPVTLVKIPVTTVAQIKTVETDGYEAVVLSVTDDKSPYLREVSLSDKFADVKVGDEVSIDILDGVELAEVVGTSKGKGFAGAMKRWNFAGGPGRVGSKFHRALGSIGTRKPRRTKPGKKMHGHLGNDRVTLKKIEIELVNKDLRVVALKGPLPGARNSYLLLEF
jgi:large subunit ribosomal protein L3